MWRILTIAAFLAVILPINGQAHGSQAGSGQDYTANTKNPIPPSRTATCVVEDNGTTIKCNWPESKPDGYLKRLVSPENATNIALFFVGLVGIFVAFCTLHKIERQTKATEDTLIQTLRPKIVVKRISLIPGRLVEVSGSQTLQDDPRWRIACVIANHGGSTARIVKSNLTLSRLGIGTLSELLPGLPAYGKDYSFEQFSIEPGERQEEKFVILSQQPDTAHLRDLHERSGNEKNISTIPLICFGFLHYRDLSGVERRTGFGAQWHPEDMSFTRLNDYPEYEYCD